MTPNTRLLLRGIRKGKNNGSRLEGRLRKYLREALERRYNTTIEAIQNLSKKAVLGMPPGLIRSTRKLEAAGTKIIQGIQKTSGKFKSAFWTRINAAGWARVIETAWTERLRGNVRGAIREQIINVHERMADLVSAMRLKVARRNKADVGQWLDPEKVRGGLQRPEGNPQELGDFLVVALAGDPPPRWKGGKVKLWIMSIVESKSPTNMWDAFDQLRADIARIQKHGLEINGVKYEPHEIKIDLSKAGSSPADRVTDLVAVLPQELRAPASLRKLGQVTKGTHIDVWEMPVAQEELEAAAELAEKAVKDLGQVFGE